MPQILPEGIRVPAGEDPYALTADLRRMMETVTTIIPVANTTARTALLAALATAGRPASTGDPVYIDRADAPAGHRLEFNIGGAWAPLVPYPVEFVSTKGSRQVIPAATMTDILTVVLPASAPAGIYRIDAVAATASGAATTHFIEVKVGGTTLNTVNLAVDGAANVTVLFPWSGTFIHAGGAATVTLRAQVNVGPANAREHTQLAVSYRGATA